MEINEDLIVKIQEHSSFPLQSVWFKTDKYFFENEKGCVAYESTRRAHVVAGDPLCVGSAECKKQLFNDFVKWSRQQGKTVCGYYFSEDFVQIIDDFSKYKVGVSCFLNLKDYKESGYKSRDIRRALNHGHKNQLQFVEILNSDKSKWLGRLKVLEQIWLQTKKGPEIFFLLDRIKDSFPGSHKERWFAITKDQNIHAFLSILPYKSELGKAYYVDHLYQFSEDEKWALDYLIAKLLRVLKNENIVEFAMGLAAFQKTRGYSPIDLSFKFNQKFEPFYSTNGLYAYKKKFSSREEPRYLIFDEKSFNLRQVFDLISVTYPRLMGAPSA